MNDGFVAVEIILGGLSACIAARKSMNRQFK